ncbi:hypothetical protein ATKI12_8879 [Kitasatospora sp. Ki12]
MQDGKFGVLVGDPGRATGEPRVQAILFVPRVIRSTGFAPFAISVAR